MGLPSGYLVIIASKYGYQGFDGEIWPMRIIGFSSGTVIGAILLHALMDEGLTIKTMLCLILLIEYYAQQKHHSRAYKGVLPLREGAIGL